MHGRSWSPTPWNRVLDRLVTYKKDVDQNMPNLIIILIDINYSIISNEVKLKIVEFCLTVCDESAWMFSRSLPSWQYAWCWIQQHGHLHLLWKWTQNTLQWVREIARFTTGIWGFLLGVTRLISKGSFHVEIMNRTYIHLLVRNWMNFITITFWPWWPYDLVKSRSHSFHLSWAIKP